jgi:uncharacterized coiled-coil DUF342 family protein
MDKMQAEIDQLHNSLLYLSEAIDRIGKGGEILAKEFIKYEQKYSEHSAYLTNKISALEAKCNLLMAEFEKIKPKNKDLRLIKLK